MVYSWIKKRGNIFSLQKLVSWEIRDKTEWNTHSFPQKIPGLNGKTISEAGIFNVPSKDFLLAKIAEFCFYAKRGASLYSNFPYEKWLPSLFGIKLMPINGKMPFTHKHVAVPGIISQAISHYLKSSNIEQYRRDRGEHSQRSFLSIYHAEVFELLEHKGTNIDTVISTSKQDTTQSLLRQLSRVYCRFEAL